MTETLVGMTTQQGRVRIQVIGNSQAQELVRRAKAAGLSLTAPNGLLKAADEVGDRGRVGRGDV
jgi:hypothetical protein